MNGVLLAAEASGLLFSIAEKKSDQKIVTSIRKLAGIWKTNPRNQLVFEVERESGKKDVLTFKSGWKVNDKHQVVYTYEETALKTKRKLTRELVFQGRWDITERNGLTYFLGGGTDSSFRFRGAFQTKSIFAKKGEIRYQAGVEVNGRRKIQEIILFGKWKVSRDLGLSFEIEADRGKKTMVFGGTYNLDPANQIAVRLKTHNGQPLGVEVVFTKDFFGRDGQAFIRLQKSIAESRIEAGVLARF